MTPLQPLRCTELFQRLVGFDTTSRNSNLELIEFVRDYLAGHGIEARLVHDESGAKANLYATIGPADKPGIALSGHTDVVPVDGQAWSRDPFALAESDGRLYGRGACDMKGFIAVALAFVPEFAAAPLATPVHLSFSYDEEIGCIGVRRLLADLDGLAVRPAACIVGEPTGMQVVRGHKGKLALTCQVRGRACHSSLVHQGANAVEAAAEAIAFLSGLARRYRDEGPFDPEFDPPYSSLQTGRIEGGVAVNIVPEACRFEVELRNLPGDDPDNVIAALSAFAEETLLPELRERAPEAAFEIDVLSRYPGLAIDENAEIVRLAKSLTGANDTAMVSFGSEAGLFQQAGIPAVLCGPGHIDQAHKPDEYVAIEQMARCEAFMARLVERARLA
jgi:acetylornithine deacetylase